MQNLVRGITKDTKADIIKLHITLNFDEYMNKDHPSYSLLRNWVFNEGQWSALINIIKDSGKELMLLVNDNEAIDFASKFNPEYIELHSSCLNVPYLQKAVNLKFNSDTYVVLGVGGSIKNRARSKIFSKRRIILMFGFQNYPLRYLTLTCVRFLRCSQCIVSLRLC